MEVTSPHPWKRLWQAVQTKPEMVTELQTRKEKVLNMTDELCAGKD